MKDPIARLNYRLTPKCTLNWMQPCGSQYRVDNNNYHDNNVLYFITQSNQVTCPTSLNMQATKICNLVTYFARMLPYHQVFYLAYFRLLITPGGPLWPSGGVQRHESDDKAIVPDGDHVPPHARPSDCTGQLLQWQAASAAMREAEIQQVFPSLLFYGCFVLLG